MPRTLGRNQGTHKSKDSPERHLALFLQSCLPVLEYVRNRTLSYKEGRFMELSIGIVIVVLAACAVTGFIVQRRTEAGLRHKHPEIEVLGILGFSVGHCLDPVSKALREIIDQKIQRLDTGIDELRVRATHWQEEIPSNQYSAEICGRQRIGRELSTEADRYTEERGRISQAAKKIGYHLPDRRDAEPAKQAA